MELVQFRNLLTREGQWSLESAMAFEPREVDFLGDFKMLSKRFPRELARAALETAILRLEAERKFPIEMASQMYFTREALEQATSWEVATYCAQRYAEYDHVYDLGCSVGGDTLALAGVTAVTGVDLDPLRLAMARANAQALGLKADFIEADLQQFPLATQTSKKTALFFDPARREDHQRVFSVADYTPPLAIIEDWLPDFPVLGVKISPGVQLEELAGYNCEVEFISLNRDLKEAVLWFGPLKTTGKRATLLPGPHTLTAEAQQPLPLSEPLAYFYEPDPAILRAGLVEALGARLGAAQLDPEIAYLTADALSETPFARVWKVEDWMPFQLKRLRTALRERNVGRVTVKKRGSPLMPEEMIQDLRLEGEEERVLFLTQVRGKHAVVIAHVLRNQESGN
jgi:SAM-dependent methyltransferase